MAAKKPERRLALRMMTMPKDTNPYGTVFGGVILSHIDQAGFVEARNHGAHRWVTAAMESVKFDAPVLLGDIVTFWTTPVKKGTTSVTVEVSVQSERYNSDEVVDVTTAKLTMVSVDPSGKPIPFTTPATVTYTAAPVNLT
jgi:acyl-CoA thioesterase YciA